MLLRDPLNSHPRIDSPCQLLPLLLLEEGGYGTGIDSDTRSDGMVGRNDSQVDSWGFYVIPPMTNVGHYHYFMSRLSLTTTLEEEASWPQNTFRLVFGCEKESNYGWEITAGDTAVEVVEPKGDFRRRCGGSLKCRFVILCSLDSSRTLTLHVSFMSITFCTFLCDKRYVIVMMGCQSVGTLRMTTMTLPALDDNGLR